MHRKTPETVLWMTGGGRRGCLRDKSHVVMSHWLGRLSEGGVAGADIITTATTAALPF